MSSLKLTLGIHILDVKAYNGYLILFEPFFFKALLEVEQVLDGVLLVSDCCTFECVFD
jgi:hypothetical protein